MNFNVFQRQFARGITPVSRTGKAFHQPTLNSHIFNAIQQVRHLRPVAQSLWQEIMQPRQRSVRRFVQDNPTNLLARTLPQVVLRNRDHPRRPVERPIFSQLNSEVVSQ
ncbi:MAG: hypothetical protein EBR81_05790 [Proteobacteria bacterium]|nr:hypothetical protein [Pseudomonadota bacterium]